MIGVRSLSSVSRLGIVSSAALFVLFAASCAGAPAAGNAGAGKAIPPPSSPGAVMSSDSEAPAKMKAKEPSPSSTRSGSKDEAPKVDFIVAEASPSVTHELLAPAPAAPSATAASPAQSGLKAGYSDDNEQFNYFVKFLDEYASVPHYPLAIGERIVVKVADAYGRGVANASVAVRSGGKLLAEGRTYADGSFYLYPLELESGTSPQADAYEVEAVAGAYKNTTSLPRKGARVATLTLGTERALPNPLPVDVLFVLDTTGSMGEEIERLRSTIEIIAANIESLKPRPELRFGMVLYRDREDDYDTEIVPLTSDLPAFRKSLDEVSAGGGGDDPEDLQAALGDAIKKIKWNDTGLRLGFIVTDAPPHLDYDQDYSYAEASADAKERGIKLFSIGAGGLPIEGEYVLRQIAQYTQGKYIFLSYGEKGEAEGGTEGSVSHHTGSNFATDKLEAIVIKFVRDEIARQSDKPLSLEEPYNEARKVGSEKSEETLSKLFERALQDLSDYSSLRLSPEAKLAIMPLAVADQGADGQGAKAIAAQAEYFGSQLGLAASKTKLFTLVERKDLQAVLGELELQLSSLSDEDSAVKAGKLLDADFLVTGTVFRGQDRYELFLKLLRVDTAEVLSATKARIDAALGL
jgi:hypothetical protein